ncbi:endoglucanase Z-like [Belonocnema kinseyi]|uniref:endoglucanase Z-like n=1 Tax=Belonocnema kinseyi TaxID=2817044 RepID=UPI00143D3868|nr:endoglucanase Z-like [Belonocnema kinseyi]
MAKHYCKVNNVIYEIWNEPKQVKWKENIKPYLLAVIKAIQDIDKKNLIVVGRSTFSQDVDVVEGDPITGFVNIAYSLNFYAGTHHQELSKKVSIALKKNIAVVVTLWGTVNADGDGTVATKETNAWVKFMTAKKLSSANRSINDKKEGASGLKKGASSDGR